MYSSVYRHKIRYKKYCQRLQLVRRVILFNYFLMFGIMGNAIRLLIKFIADYHYIKKNIIFVVINKRESQTNFGCVGRLCFLCNHY